MKILHITHQYLPEHVGGTELYTQWVAHRQAQRGYEVHIFCRRFVKGAGSDSHLDSEGVRVWAAWSGEFSPRSRFRAMFKEQTILKAFSRMCEQIQPDLVHIQHLMGLPVAIADYLQQGDIPFLITLHDYWWVCANAQLITNYSQQICDGPQAYLNCARCVLSRAGQPNLWPLIPVLTGPLAWRNWRLQRVMNSAHKLITPTQFVSDWYAGYGVPEEKLQVIPHGFDLPSQIVRSDRATDTPLRFVYIVGGLTWQKGGHILLQAFAEIKGQAELWVVGDETTDPIYASKLHTLASGKVRFWGKLTHEAVWDIWSQVDVVVVPALWYETFSFIVSEAYAAGVPVVASRLGPLADRVKDGIDGLLVPAGDVPALGAALQRFLQEPALLAHLQSGIQPVRTLDDHVNDLETVYDPIIN